MEERKEHTDALDLMYQPAFSVENGLISHVNPAAAQFMLQPGMPIAVFITSGNEEYAQFSQGQLHLTLYLAGQTMGATVSSLDSRHIFLPDHSPASAQLQAYALAAQQLRMPLSGLFSAVDAISQKLDDPQLCALAAQANRRLMQLQRMIGNMSDAELYHHPETHHMEYTQVDRFLAELLEKAGYLLESAGGRVCWEAPGEAVFTLVDREKLERAVLNMLSNAVKFSPKGEPILVQLRRQGTRIYCSVTNRGDGIQPNAYSRYLRSPALEDPNLGIGLGMVLMRSVAAIHGGALLIDQPQSDQIRVTLSLAIRQSKQDLVRMPVLPMDYAGEQDHILLELSDVLPAECYDRNKT